MVDRIAFSFSFSFSHIPALQLLGPKGSFSKGGLVSQVSSSLTGIGRAPEQSAPNSKRLRSLRNACYELNLQRPAPSVSALRPPSSKDEAFLLLHTYILCHSAIVLRYVALYCPLRTVLATAGVGLVSTGAAPLAPKKRTTTIYLAKSNLIYTTVLTLTNSCFQPYSFSFSIRLSTLRYRHPLQLRLSICSFLGWTPFSPLPCFMSPCLLV